MTKVLQSHKFRFATFGNFHLIKGDYEYYSKNTVIFIFTYKMKIPKGRQISLSLELIWSLFLEKGFEVSNGIGEIASCHHRNTSVRNWYSVVKRKYVRMYFANNNCHNKVKKACRWEPHHAHMIFRQKEGVIEEVG